MSNDQNKENVIVEALQDLISYSVKKRNLNISIDKDLVSKIITEYLNVGNLDSIPDCFEKEYFLKIVDRNSEPKDKVMTDEDIDKIELQLESTTNDFEKTKIIINTIDTYSVFPDRMKEIFKKYKSLVKDIRQSNKK